MRGVSENGRSRIVQRARMVLPTQPFLVARRRETLPIGQPKNSFSVPQAQRSGRTHRSAKKASPAVRPASLRDQTQSWYTAREQFFFPDWNAVHNRARPPNPALQLTASRARSLLF
jgi:hypothetical protein